MTTLFDTMTNWLGEERGLLVLELAVFLLLVAVIMLGLMMGIRLVGAGIRRLNRDCGEDHQRVMFLKNMLERTYWFTPVALAGLAALAIYHPLSEKLETTLRIVCLSFLFIQGGLWATGLMNLWLEKGLRSFRVSEEAATSAMGVVRFFGLVLIWSVLLLMIFSNMGIQIGPLLAGLGVGGIAIAFALQKILGDVFCSVAIILDKPFEVGDFIIVDPANLGTVEKIGIKTTRVRSLTGEQIIFSNADLLDARLHNFKRMNERRVLFGFGVLYQTPVDVLEKIPGRVKAIIEGQEMARFDRAHMKEFGASAYNFEVVYYVLDRDFTIYMNTQQKINFAIIRLLEELSVEFAYPTQTLHIESWPALQQTPGESADASAVQ